MGELPQCVVSVGVAVYGTSCFLLRTLTTKPALWTCLLVIPPSRGGNSSTLISFKFLYFVLWYYLIGFPSWLSGKESACLRGRQRRCAFHPWVGKIPWRRENGKPLQYSCLGNPRDRGECWTKVHGVSRESDIT